jgi:type II secretory pathway component GspD/PulD (secretin)
VLGSLPGVGRLFRRTDNTEENKNLLVFVTATVISERGESLLTTPSSSARMESRLP